MPIEHLHQPLLAWFDAYKRALPWRETRDPYAIWVSEVMLQQTQVATVIPYWCRWMERFPTVDALARADEQEALSIWQGLGYYRRCRMLLGGSKFVVQHGMPRAAAGLRKVPGIGRYTAGAIASIAFGEATPVVDGNIERVFARLTGCSESGAALSRAAWSWATMTLVDERPGDWNQALMELGAVVCRPTSPLCGECPLSNQCVAYLNQSHDRFPAKPARLPTVELRYFVVVPISRRCRFGVRQIPAGQWWAGMWEFPRESNFAELPAVAESIQLGELRHSVTNHRITLKVSLASEVEERAELTWLTIEEMESLPMPAPQRKIFRLALAPRLL